jgi:hypothetical protein
MALFRLFHEPYYKPVPADTLVENIQRIDVWEVVPKGRKGGQPITREADLSINGTSIALTWDEPMPKTHRCWFRCPTCARRVRHLYLPELSCRHCRQLDYLVRHTTVPAVLRVVRLRKQLGLSPRPFEPIPRRQRHCSRWNRRAARLRAEERKLLDRFRDLNDGLAELRRETGLR